MPLDTAKIRELRDKLTLNQSEAAARAGWNDVAGKVRWSEIETGKFDDPGVSKVIAVARVLGVTVEDLFIDARPKDQKINRPSSAAGSKALPSASTAKVRATSIVPPSKGTRRRHSSH